MKSNFAFLTLVLFLAACKKEEIPTQQKDTPVTKTVEYAIGRSDDYASAYYDDVSAEIRATIYLSDYNTSASIQVWDTVINVASIKTYTPLAQPTLVTKSITNPEPGKYKIGTSFNTRFFKSGAIHHQTALIDWVSADETSKRIVIPL